MELWLSKLLPFWIYPLGFSVAILFLVFLSQLFSGRIKTAFVLLLVTGGLWLSSTQRASEWLIWTLERDYPEQAMGMVGQAEAILLLGGALTPPTHTASFPNLHESSDRILHAMRLYKAGKAAKVVISGGQLPWEGAPQSESEATAELLVGWGVPAEAILVEKVSANTYQNAIFSKAILKEQGIAEVLLVTSAFHMPRAMAVFERAGIRAVPAATDHLGARDGDGDLLEWMPDPWALYVTTLAIKEYVGMAYYRWKGWA
jgi:uncharacterized SAM-binding protein YcdF (DUF218 family)